MSAPLNSKSDLSVLSGHPQSAPTVSLGETDPVSEGNRIVELFARSAQEYVAACVLIKNMLKRFPHGTPEFTQFAEVLVSARHLSESEAARGAKSGKLSKLCKIGEYADVLLLPELLRCVEAGYTVAYQACLLHEALPGELDTKTQALIEIVDSAPDLTKEHLVGKTQDAKAINTDIDDDQSNAEPDEPDILQQIAQQSIDLILATPPRETMRLLSETLSDHSALFRCLKFYELVAKEAVLVVIAKIAGLPTIEAKLFPCCGFKRFAHVLLVRQPTSADIGGADVVIVGIRGSVQPILLTSDSWLSEKDEVLDPVAIAERLFPDAERKLHVFATERSDSWSTLIGDENWSEQLTLK